MSLLSQRKSSVKIILLFSFFLGITLSQGQTDDSIPAIIFYKDGSLAMKNVSLESFFRKYEVLEQGQKQSTDAKLINKIVVDSITYFLREDKTGRIGTWIILEKLAEGKINLYGTPNQIESRIYYAEQDSVLRPLRKMTRKTEDGRLLTIDEYKSVITFFTRTCPLINDKTIKNLKLNEASLKQIIAIYNNGCALPIATPVDSSGFILKKINKESTPLLMEKLLEGKINFYAEVGNGSNKRLFAEKDTFFLELREYARFAGSRRINVEEFKAHLRILTLDCKQAEAKLKTLVLSKKSIYQFIYSYNKECGWIKNEQRETFADSLQKRVSSFSSQIRSTMSILTGYCFSNATLSRAHIMEINRPFIGASVTFQKGYSRYSLRNTLIYEHISTSEGPVIPANNRNARVNWKYNIQELRDQIAFQFLIFRKDKIGISGSMGLSINMQLSNTSTQIDTYYRSNGSEDKVIYYLKGPTINTCPFSGLGFRYGLFEISYSFQILGRNTELDSLTNENRFMVSYSLLTRQKE